MLATATRRRSTPPPTCNSYPPTHPHQDEKGSVFSKHPCDSALTDAQLKQLTGEVPTARHTDNAAGPGCGWTKQSTAAGINVAWMTGLKNGLSDYYAKKSTDAYQQALTIGGYPAVEYNSTEAQ